MEDYYTLFLCWTFVLYGWSWHHTVGRRESELIEVDRKLAKILFFIKNTDGMSVFSIILGLTAHAGMILFLLLVIFSKTVNRYMRILFFFMVCSQHAFSGGRGIDRDIYQKEKSQNKTRQGIEFCRDDYSRIHSCGNYDLYGCQTSFSVEKCGSITHTWICIGVLCEGGKV